MATLEKYHSIHADEAHAELHYTIGGYWTEETMKDFLTELARAAMPFIKRKQPFAAIGDLSDFVPQDRETAAAIRDSLMMAKQNGLNRFALIGPSALVKLQYKRLGEGLDMEFFDSKADALAWLRA